MQPVDLPTEEATQHFQFRIVHVVYVMAVIGAAIALMGVPGLIWAALVIGFWIKASSDDRRNRDSKVTSDRGAQNSGFTYVELLVVISIIGILIGMLLPAVRRVSPEMREYMLRRHHMRQIAMAIHNYELENGHLPPAYVADEDGTPMHSWRVLVLPFLEHENTFEAYCLEEPWDSPHNLKLAEEVDIFAYKIHGRKPGDENLTATKLITGTGTAFDGDKKVRLADITAGTSQTLMMVEDNVNLVPWNSPQDVDIEEVSLLFDKVRNPETMSRVRTTKFEKRTIYGSAVCLFDVSFENVDTLKDPESIKDFCLIDNQREKLIEDVEFEHRLSKNEMVLEGYLLLGLNAALAILPAFWIRLNVPVGVKKT